MWLMSRVPRDSRTPVITARTVVINPCCRECVEVIKGYADPRQLLGRSELYGEVREVPPDGRYRTYCHIRIPVWRAVRIPDHNNVKWKTFTVVLG
ncbi:hypothetical protein ALC57_09234 [Trachymyrmex cornetzi]|uniref:Uncharacterized protein n=1 Tax=Trachymyrmex cornetzi TaxID=471704 RepID=A0A195E101_9HYME|nr:hypothetical protein ALC57_09234 [Trachymyrmex cornetzi]